MENKKKRGRPKKVEPQPIYRTSMMKTPESKVVIPGVSMTKPDMAYSVKDLIRRFEQGIIDPVKESVENPTDNFDSPDLQELHNMDIWEKYEYMVEHRNSTLDMESDYNNQIQRERQKVIDEAKESLKAEFQPDLINQGENNTKPA